MEKIYNIVQFDPDGCFGCARTFYHIKCTETKIKEIIDEYNKIVDPYGCSWSYNEMKLKTPTDMEKEIERHKLECTSC